jgi:hypothetical protein
MGLGGYGGKASGPWKVDWSASWGTGCQSTERAQVRVAHTHLAPGERTSAQEIEETKDCAEWECDKECGSGLKRVGRAMTPEEIQVMNAPR